MRKLMLLALCLVAVPALALSPQNAVQGQAVVSNVIDGDTYDLTIMDFDTFERIAEVAPAKASEHLNRRAKIMRVRLNGVDTAEMDTPQGRQAKRRVSQWIAGEQVGFRCFDFGHYGRVICHISDDGRDLGQRIIINGLSDYIDQYGNDPFLHSEYTQAEQ